MNMDINGLFNYKQHYSFCIKYLVTFEFVIRKCKINGCALKVSLRKPPLSKDVSRSMNCLWVCTSHLPLCPKKKLPH